MDLNKGKFKFNKKQQSNANDLNAQFNEFSKDKKFTADMIKDYLDSVNPTATALLDALKTFAEAQRNSSHNVKEMLAAISDVLKEELARELTDDQRDRIHAMLGTMITEIREESKENREFYRDLSKYAIGSVVIVAGVGILLASQGKNKELLEKGAQMLVSKKL
ncbi:hypothetical protein [Paenibacillus sp. FSL E2-0178]|uniref:hypothetical protein n=1 Tax=Paenibacillus sp. FSL E2-0178 TaxID=2921361 RepID=UPI00315989D8